MCEFMCVHVCMSKLNCVNGTSKKLCGRTYITKFTLVMHRFNLCYVIIEWLMNKNNENGQILDKHNYPH